MTTFCLEFRDCTRQPVLEECMPHNHLLNSTSLPRSNEGKREEALLTCYHSFFKKEKKIQLFKEKTYFGGRDEKVFWKLWSKVTVYAVCFSLTSGLTKYTGWKEYTGSSQAREAKSPGYLESLVMEEAPFPPPSVVIWNRTSSRLKLHWLFRKKVFPMGKNKNKTKSQQTSRNCDKIFFQDCGN